MLRPSAFASGTPSAPRLAPILPLLVSFALVVMLRGRPVTLVDPAACPGVMEVAIPMALRWMPHVAMGSVLGWTNAVLAVVALAGFTRVMQLASGGIVFAASSCAALALTGILDPTLAPPSAMLALAAASAAWLTMRAINQERTGPGPFDKLRAGPPGGMVPTVLAVAAIALVVPQLLVACLVVIALLMVDRAGPRSHAAVTIGTTSCVLLVTFLVSVTALRAFDAEHAWIGALGCVLPFAGARNAVEPATLFTIVSRIGPLPFALAALGGFCCTRSLTAPRAWRVAALAVTLVTIAMHAPDPGALVPLWAAFWCLVSVGLAEVMDACRRRVVHTIGALALVVLVPLLQVQQRRITTPIPAVSPLGHDRLTAAGFLRGLRLAPGATMIREDAGVDLMLRSISGRMEKTGSKIRVIDRRTESVQRALADGPVVAFPRAQLELQHRGVRFSEAPTGMRGIAMVSLVAGCAAVSESWTSVGVAAQAPALALIAANPQGEGPVRLFVASSQVLSPAPIEWPMTATRGLQSTGYARAAIPDLNGRLVDLALPPDSPLLAAPHITRIRMWRTPGAPAVLPISFAAAPLAVVASAEPGSQSRGLELCASFPFPVRPIDLPR